MALSYLAATGTPTSLHQVWDAFENAATMTDEFAGLQILCAADPSLRRKSAARFYERWSHDPLVLDKWFLAQAVSPLPGTPEAVKDLADHPDFSLTNPNRVRALIYGFALHNPIRFHETDGSGYAFVTKKSWHWTRSTTRWQPGWPGVSSSGKNMIPGAGPDERIPDVSGSRPGPVHQCLRNRIPGTGVTPGPDFGRPFVCLLCPPDRHLSPR